MSTTITVCHLARWWCHPHPTVDYIHLFVHVPPSEAPLWRGWLLPTLVLDLSLSALSGEAVPVWWSEIWSAPLLSQPLVCAPLSLCPNREHQMSFSVPIWKPHSRFALNMIWKLVSKVWKAFASPAFCQRHFKLIHWCVGCHESCAILMPLAVTSRLSWPLKVAAGLSITACGVQVLNWLVWWEVFPVKSAYRGWKLRLNTLKIASHNL